MGINEEITELNKRLATLAKKQDEFKKLLAVEEHKVVELTSSLKEEGIEVAGMNEESLEELTQQLLTDLMDSKNRLNDKLAEVEQLYTTLDTLR